MDCGRVIAYADAREAGRLLLTDERGIALCSQEQLSPSLSIDLPPQIESYSLSSCLRFEGSRESACDVTRTRAVDRASNCLSEQATRGERSWSEREAVIRERALRLPSTLAACASCLPECVTATIDQMCCARRVMNGAALLCSRKFPFH